MSTLREAYCSHFDCPPEEFEEDLLVACMSNQAAFFGRWILQLNPGFFAPEIGRLRQVGNLTDSRYVYDFAAEFSDPRRSGGIVRVWLGIRPRGRTLIAISLDVMSNPGGEAKGKRAKG
jgi:hypothetical protein